MKKETEGRERSAESVEGKRKEGKRRVRESDGGRKESEGR